MRETLNPDAVRGLIASFNMSQNRFKINEVDATTQFHAQHLAPNASSYCTALSKGQRRFILGLGAARRWPRMKGLDGHTAIRTLVCAFFRHKRCKGDDACSC